MKYHYRIDPDTLDDDAWMKLYAEYRWVRKRELKENEIAVHNALAEVINRIFSKNGFNNDTMDTGTGG